VTPNSKIYGEKVKMCWFSSRDWFFCIKFVQLAVAGDSQLCTSKKECNKLDLAAVQYCSLVDRNDWSRWFAISSSRVYAVPVTVLVGGGIAKKKKQLNLDITINYNVLDHEAYEGGRV
jgi:hypothetical protein